jgi:hypothetical protein
LNNAPIVLCSSNPQNIWDSFHRIDERNSVFVGCNLSFQAMHQRCNSLIDCCKPPPIIEDHPILEDPPIIEDPQKSFLHSNFLFFPAKIIKNLKRFDGS